MKRDEDEKVKIKTTMKSLKKRGFQAYLAKDRIEAKDLILHLVPQDAIVCVGDSSTVRQIQVIEALKSRGNMVINPFDPTKKIKDEETFFDYLFRPSIEASTGDVFLTGTNALTEDGKIVNVDGAGNRVAGMFWGHPISIIAVGKNKIVKDFDEALDRIKNMVAPEHIKRRGGKAPCTKTGRCHDCNGVKRVCAITTIIEHKPLLTNIHVIIINEDLGLAWDKKWPKDRIEKIAEEHERFMWSPLPEVLEKANIAECWTRLISMWKRSVKERKNS